MVAQRGWRCIGAAFRMTSSNKDARRLSGLGLLLIGALLIGGFVVPSLLDSHIAAGENAAIAALINISEAETVYRDRYPQIGFAPSVSVLSVSRTKDCAPSPQQACMIEHGLAHAERPFRGYNFADTADAQQPHASYTIVAAPVTYNRTGVRSFCVVERGVPRYRDFGRDTDPHSITREQCLRDFTPLP